MYDHVRLLRVSMSDASVLLGCVQGADRRKDLRRLTTTLFQHRWCYRPKEMAPNWTNMEQWCVWGFADPEVPPTCAGGPAPDLCCRIEASRGARRDRSRRARRA